MARYFNANESLSGLTTGTGWDILCGNVYSLLLDKRIQIPKEDNHIVANLENQNEIVAFLDLKVLLSSRGLELLNQIDLKNAIVKFNESSDKSNKKLGDYTYVLLVFTIIIAMSALVQLYSYAEKGTVPMYLFYSMVVAFIAAYALLIITRNKNP